MEEDVLCDPSTHKKTEAQVISQSKVAKTEDAIVKNNRRKELHFKALHLLLIAFFLWLLCVPFIPYRKVCLFEQLPSCHRQLLLHQRFPFNPIGFGTKIGMSVSTL